MKWVSHIAISGAVTFAFNPLLVPVGILGGTAPDWLEILASKAGYPVKHRTVTHYLSYWVALSGFGAFVWDFQGVIFWFGVGGLTHVLADSLTVSGIPLGLWSDRRFHLFGGRIRTGRPGEVFATLSVVGIFGGLGVLNQNFAGGFLPFFYDWPGLYHNGLIDGYEWKQNRFRWF